MRRALAGILMLSMLVLAGCATTPEAPDIGTVYIGGTQGSRSELPHKDFTCRDF